MIFNAGFDENFISDYLAYILDPSENGIGNSPLVKLIRKFKNYKDITLKNIDRDDINIHREYTFNTNKRIDLLIELGNELVIGIENKIHSSEGYSQTNSYANSIEEEFSEIDSLMIYLTLDGSIASSPSFRPLSYYSLLNLIKDINYDFTKNIRKSVIFNDFILHLEEYIMGKESLKLSEKGKLFLEHREMFNDLEDAFSKDTREVFNYLKSYFKSHYSGPEWEFNFKKDRGYQQIYKREWKKHDGINIHYEFYYNAKKLIFGKKITYMVHIEGKRRKELRSAFEKYYEQNKQKYKENNIRYKKGKRAAAIKKYDYNFKDIEDVFEKAVKEFDILTSIIDSFVEDFTE